MKEVHLNDLAYKSQSLCGKMYPTKTTDLTAEQGPVTCESCIRSIKEISNRVPVPAVWIMMIDRFNNFQKQKP